jgi:hypothetical protein
MGAALPHPLPSPTPHPLIVAIGYQDCGHPLEFLRVWRSHGVNIDEKPEKHLVSSEISEIR